MTLSIIIPSYNEEKRIGATLREYSKLSDCRILIVVNNTTDKTVEIIKEYQKRHNNIDYLDLKEGGKGRAIIEGYKHALATSTSDSEYIAFVDADMSTQPDEILRLSKKLQCSPEYDGIIASRYIKGANISPKPTFSRIIASRVFNAYIRVLFMFPYKDTQCGAKIFKREVIVAVVPNLITTRWAFDVDLLYNVRKKRFRVLEEPTTWSDKEYSKINFMRAGPFMALSMLRLRLLNSPFKFILDFYDKVLPDKIKFYNRFR